MLILEVVLLHELASYALPIQVDERENCLYFQLEAVISIKFRLFHPIGELFLEPSLLHSFVLEHLLEYDLQPGQLAVVNDARIDLDESGHNNATTFAICI